MRPSLLQPLWLALWLLAINFLVFLLLTTTVRPWLDDYIAAHYEARLQEARKVMSRYFSSHAEDWESTARALGERLGARCNIVPANRHNFSEAVLARLRQASAKQGVIDPVKHFIYVPLDGKQVAVLDPPPHPAWLLMLDRDLHWLVALGVNVLLVYLYLRYRERRWSRLEEEIRKLPGMDEVDSGEEKDLLDQIRRLREVLARRQREHGSLMLLQRDLLHGVAHEFRSPMARIQFALEMTEDADENEQAELREGMRQALSDLDKLVQELLYYARLKDSRSELRISSLTLEPLLTSCLEQVSPFYPDVAFRLIDQAGDVQVQGDERLMKRMLLNLLRNAGRFARSRCEVSLLVEQDHVLIRIEDDGVGIPPGKVSRIFEPFTRLDPSRSRDSGGCGLGLAIVASIVRKHGGKIEVRDSDLGGACFEIILDAAGHSTSTE